MTDGDLVDLIRQHAGAQAAPRFSEHVELLGIGSVLRVELTLDLDQPISAVLTVTHYSDDDLELQITWLAEDRNWVTSVTSVSVTELEQVLQLLLAFGDQARGRQGPVAA